MDYMMQLTGWLIVAAGSIAFLATYPWLFFIELAILVGVWLIREG